VDRIDMIVRQVCHGVDVDVVVDYANGKSMDLST
jgi:hypothetical protein